MDLEIIYVNGIPCSGKITLEELQKLPAGTVVEVYLSEWPGYDMENLRNEAEWWRWICEAHGCVPAFTYVDLLEEELELVEALVRVGAIPYEYYEEVVDELIKELKKDACCHT